MVVVVGVAPRTCGGAFAGGCGGRALGGGGAFAGGGGGGAATQIVLTIVQHKTFKTLKTYKTASRLEHEKAMEKNITCHIPC